MRQFQFRVGHENFALIHVSLVPIVNGEQKTKPTQASVRDLRGLGLTPDLVACRSGMKLAKTVTDKIGMFCHVGPDQVVAVHDVSSVYHVPLLLEDQGLIKFFTKRLRLHDIKTTDAQRARGQRLSTRWKQLTAGHDRLFDKVTIVLVGKYITLQDSYMSVVKSLEHASLRCNRKLILEWVDSEDLEANAATANPVKYHEAWHKLCSANGVLVPGGFGIRGTEGKIAAAKWAREQKIPFLGICLGLQIATIEFARNVCGLADAHSTELVPETKVPMVIDMPELSKTHLGGTMRLGLRPTIFQEGTEKWSKVRRLYGGVSEVQERHRHRYEINPKYISTLESHGLTFVGKDDKGERMEIIEMADHPYFVGTQYHPEYLTRPLEPSPPYLGFIAAASGCLEEQMMRQMQASAPTNGVHVS